MKRQLEKAEIELNHHAIKRFEDEITDLSYILKDAILKYEEGLDYSYRKQKKEYKDVIAEVRKKIESNTKQIEILNDQIKKGVEKKENNIAS